MKSKHKGALAGAAAATVFTIGALQGVGSETDPERDVHAGAPTTQEAAENSTTTHIDTDEESHPYTPPGPGDVSSETLPQPASTELGMVGGWVAVNGVMITTDANGTIEGSQLPANAPDLLDPQGPNVVQYEPGQVDADGTRHVSHDVDAEGPFYTTVQPGRETVIKTGSEDGVNVAISPAGALVSFAFNEDSGELRVRGEIPRAGDEPIEVAVIDHGQVGG